MAVAPVPSLHLVASARPVGHVTLMVSGPPGAAVVVTEPAAAPGRVVRVRLDARGRARTADAVTWSCTRHRTFVATAGGARAEAAVTTPSCVHRYAVGVGNETLRAGHRLRLRLTDRFGLDDQPVDACLDGACTRFEAGRAWLVPAVPGRDTVTFAAPGALIRGRAIIVRRADRDLTLLATGDSMMGIVDDLLRERLAPDHVTVSADARPATGLTKPRLLDWPRHAADQVAAMHPDVVVAFLGANDGFPLGRVRCCSHAWVRRYAKRADRMVKTWSQHGRTPVYWCLLPAPPGDRPFFRRYYLAVNAGIRRAIRRNPGAAHVVDLPRWLTPGYTFRRYVDGKRVRQDDGVHLSADGASIAADVIQFFLGRDGAV
ncbi:MAG: uncharacterized protein QOF76_3342 [Solirubrobacteraceae bacterium]|nr:uncharacterized protein [Solirubrobacteraceae bacterium]